MNIFTEKALAILVVIVVFNAAFQYWYYHVDGISMNPAITYVSGVDPLNLQLEKTSYKPGETIYYHNAFCKHRDSDAVIQWTLVDTEQRFYSVKPAANLPVGCYPANWQMGETGLLQLETLFLDVRPACDYFFVGTLVRDIGGGRKVTTNLKTQKFCVTK